MITNILRTERKKGILKASRELMARVLEKCKYVRGRESPKGGTVSKLRKCLRDTNAEACSCKEKMTQK